MGGASIPQGFFGGGTTGGSSIGWSGGQGLGGTTAAVANPTKPGALMAYDAGSMATSLTPAAPLKEALGIANSGTGAVGQTGAAETSTAGDLYKPAAVIPPVKKATTPVAKKVATTAGNAAAASAAAKNAQPNYTLIPLNAAGGYNAPGTQQPMAVGQFWNGSHEQTLAVPPVGGASNAPMIHSKGIYTDNNGKFFSKDPSGKFVQVGGTGFKPTTPGSGNLYMPGQGDYVGNFFKAWGY